MISGSFRDVALAVKRVIANARLTDQDPTAAYAAATDLLRGDRRREVSASIPISHRWFEKLCASARDAYGLSEGLPDRPARALVLIAGEHSFVPLAEGVARAADWWPSSMRLDMRSAFDVVAQWRFVCDPRLAALTAAALSTPAGPLVWSPFSSFYDHVLRAHDRDAERRKLRAASLAVTTVEVVTASYREGGATSGVIRGLLSTCEEMGILRSRPRFEPDPSLLRRNELARLILDLELCRSSDAESEALVELLRNELTVR